MAEAIPPFNPYVLPLSSRAPESFQQGETVTSAVVDQQRQAYEQARAQAHALERALVEKAADGARERLGAANDLLDTYGVIAAVASGRGDGDAVQHLAARASKTLAAAPADVRAVRAAEEIEGDPAGPDTLAQTAQAISGKLRRLAATAEQLDVADEATDRLRDIANRVETGAAAPGQPKDSAEGRVDVEV